MKQHSVESRVPYVCTWRPVTAKKLISSFLGTAFWMNFKALGHSVKWPLLPEAWVWVTHLPTNRSLIHFFVWIWVSQANQRYHLESLRRRRGSCCHSFVLFTAIFIYGHHRSPSPTLFTNHHKYRCHPLIFHEFFIWRLMHLNWSNFNIVQFRYDWWKSRFFWNPKWLHSAPHAPPPLLSLSLSANELCFCSLQWYR